MRNDYIVSLLCNQLMSYFGDTGDYAEALASVIKDMQTRSETHRVFQEGLNIVLSDNDFDWLKFVSHCANRARTREDAREWLEQLRDDTKDVKLTKKWRSEIKRNRPRR